MSRRLIAGLLVAGIALAIVSAFAFRSPLAMTPPTVLAPPSTVAKAQLPQVSALAALIRKEIVGRGEEREYRIVEPFLAEWLGREQRPA